MTAPNTGLIPTKLQMPPLKTQLFYSAMLLDQFAAGQGFPLTAIDYATGSR